MPTRVLLAALLAAAQTAAASDTFSFDMGDLRLRVIVPDIPQMRMEAQGNERFSGANGAYTMSLLLPKAEAGTTRATAQAPSRVRSSIASASTRSTWSPGRRTKRPSS
jgi:hypothetical protein